MPNIRKHALRYLLLRHMTALKGSVPEALYEEVSGSLVVEEGEELFDLTWRREGKDFKKTYRKNEWEFYVRADLAQPVAANAAIDPERNGRLAREFSSEALGASNARPGIQKEPLFPRSFLDFMGYLAAGIILALTSFDARIYGAAAAIPLMASVEFLFQRGRFASVLFFPIFLLSGHYFTSALVSGVALIIHFLDPNPAMRRMRVLGCLLMLGGSVFAIFKEGGPIYLGGVGVLTLLAAFGIFLARWVSGSHFRSFPLLFPFLGAGLYFDGYRLPAFACLALAACAAVWALKGFHFFPVQKERILTPNG